ncbi:hypothetical protein PZB75_20405 [Streptomyces sp. AM 4-1-1]|uniref:DUF7677 family protein n=1 Tax=Streptomyces sp. AM 4-1-1 TaxID=3028710 RepID=UPI0023B9013D|nr:hypothetical protein [Streptomyces sp. AM 4-1-1]WEH35505.1 hypothetical protein PZB75_20405 [Streptomyces sp. AM 4-1-1]
MGHLSVDVRASLRLFAFYLANGTIDVDLLDGFDYRPAPFQFGSPLEQAFAAAATPPMRSSRRYGRHRGEAKSA